MRINRVIPFAVAAALATAIAGGVAFAADQTAAETAAESAKQDGADATALAGLKVTLPQAIASAERQSGGRAVSADVVTEGGTTRIAVEVAGPQGTKTVMVDGQSGQVTAAAGQETAEDGETAD